MHSYYLSHWERGSKESNIIIVAEDISDLYNKLVEKYSDKQICLNGHNYEYITNASHLLAAGYLEAVDSLTISESRTPAHFNQEFFYIIGYQD